MSYLLTGGSGILGQELQKHIECHAPSRKEWDILDSSKFTETNKIYALFSMAHKNGVKLIVHCAAFTDLNRAEKEKELCYQTNVIGTRNLASLGIPMLYISTEYVFDGEKGDYDEKSYPNPRNFYSLTKLLGEYESRRTKSCVVRCLFKPTPFKHAFACVDQYTSGDTVRRIAEDLVIAIRNFDRLPETIHIGTERKSTFELAKRTRPNVKPCSVEDIKNVKLPKDTSLNISKWLKLKEELCR
jgi:dTDP-4-dehydrorhamnose reductase